MPAPPTLRPTVAPVTRRPALVVEPIEAWPAPVSAPAPVPVSQPAQMLPPAPVASMAPFSAPLAAPLSVAPVARSMPPASMRSQRSSRLGTFTLGLALAAGLLVTLYRNDVLLDLARNWQYETAFLSMERSLLGGPTPGTTRALEGLVATAPATQPGAPLAAASEPTTAGTPTEAKPASKVDTGDEAASTKTALAPEQLAPADPEPEEAPAKAEPAAKAEAPAPKAASRPPAKPAVRSTRAASKPSSRSLAASVQAHSAKAKAKAAPPAEDAAPKPPKKVTKSALDRAIADAVTRPKSKSKAAPKPKGAEYDPMNGAL
jgi:hypothetical protein